MVRLDQLIAPVPGSFSGLGRDEIAGDMECGFQAGLALVRRTGERAQLVRMSLHADRRVNWTACRALRAASGRDLLLCREDILDHGYHHQSLVAVDYARDQDRDEDYVVSVTDTTDTACIGASDAIAANLGPYDLVDINHDGALDVRVRVGAARIRVRPRSDCQMGREGSGDPPKVRRPPMETVELLLQGEALVPTAKSARVLAKLKVLSPP